MMGKCSRVGVISLDDKELDELLNSDIDDILNKWMEMPASEEEKPQEELPAKEEATPAEPEKKDEKQGWQKTVLMYLHDLVYLLSGLVLVFLLLFRVVVVSGTSMNNTLLDGDYLLLLSSTFYQNPEYGDIIVASKQSFDNGAPIVKRVIATEGQWIGIDYEEGVVYVGDTKDTMEPLEEPYTLTPTYKDEGMHVSLETPLEIPQGCLFVMGDNRADSLDSRSTQIGLVDQREVLGKVFFLFLPGTNYNQVAQEFGRIGVVE